MPIKTKEVYSEQKCENCVHFGDPVDNKRCVEKCKKQIILTRFRPSEEQALFESLDANPELKAKIKLRLETEDASIKT